MSDNSASITTTDLTERLTAPGTRLIERIDKMENVLLREFRKFAIGFESEFRTNQALVMGLNERLVSLEERVSDIEQRDRPGS